MPDHGTDDCKRRAEPPAAPPTIETSASVARVDVVVTDGRGAPLRRIEVTVKRSGCRVREPDGPGPSRLSLAGCIGLRVGAGKG